MATDTMSATAYIVRRATIDDLPFLLGLWGRMNLPAATLEKKLIEFQLVEAAPGEILGALGMEISGRHGRLHSEAFTDFGLADVVRDLLWHRMQALAANHGLARIWHSETIPFWRQNGFQNADSTALKRLPAAWASLSSDWVTLPLRDEDALQKSLDVDFDHFKLEQEKALNETLRKTKMLKNAAVAIGMTVAILGFVFTLYLLVNNARFHR